MDPEPLPRLFLRHPMDHMAASTGQGVGLSFEVERHHVVVHAAVSFAAEYRSRLRAKIRSRFRS